MVGQWKFAIVSRSAAVDNPKTNRSVMARIGRYMNGVRDKYRDQVHEAVSLEDVTGFLLSLNPVTVDTYSRSFYVEMRIK